jgi:hypothetical protein
MDINLIRDRLIAGEKLLWSGQPRQGILFVASDALMIPFSLMWGGFAIFWEASVLTVKAPILFRLWGIPFVLIGLYLIVGRFFADAWIRRDLCYGVTNFRILIARPAPFARFVAISLDRLQAELSVRNDGSGDITFGAAAQYGRRGFGVWLPALDQTPRFIGIQDVRRVFDLIQSQSQARSA